jgi:1-acyl-sn-glycerol-3-phosphate acyltransferase
MVIEFRPAKHHDWIIRIGQLGNALDLAWRARLRLDWRDLELLKTIPQDSGLILVANHADEMDMKVCMELSRRSRRRFTYMINSEAFDEYHGIAGWWLQRLGGFSVEKGGADQTAKRYAVDVVKKGRDALVIFPEGEIYYLNDLVQPFKTGAVHIGLQAIAEAQKERPDWTAYLLPVAIKYRYRKTIKSTLDKKIHRMEKRLFKRTSYFTFQKQLALIMAELLNRQEPLGRIQMISEKLARLKEQVQEARLAILSEIESKYREIKPDPKAQLIDRAQKLIFFLRKQLNQKRLFSPETRMQLQADLKELKRTIQMAGWHPQYIDLNPSEERLAETVMKLEREVFEKKRPRPLGNRDVFVRIGNPVDLGRYVDLYKKNPSFISRQIAEDLRDNIQSLIEKVLWPV